MGSPTDWLKLFAGVQEVDTLVHESTYATRDKWKAEKWGHSSAGEAGDHAKILKAKTLLLNHFSIRYFSQDERGILELLRDAQLTCSPGTNVIAAYDGFVFELY